MTPRDDERFDPEQELARRAVRGLPPAAARAEFRARLSREFADGSLARGLPEMPDAAVLAERPRRRIRPLRFKGWLVLLAPAAAAAALLLVLQNGGPGWQVQTPAPGESLTIDGVELPVRDAAELSRRLRAGARITLPAGEPVTLVSADRIALRIMPGTEMTMPGVPGRFWGRSVAATLDEGQLLITTARSFQGARLAVTTPDATVEIRGTTLAVLRPGFYTCVCVHEGTVRVGALGRPPEPVPAGGRITVFPEEGVVDRGAILEEEERLLEGYRGCCLPEVPSGWTPPPRERDRGGSGEGPAGG